MTRPEIVYHVMPFEGAWRVSCEGIAYQPIVRPDKATALSTAILIAQRQEPARVLLRDDTGRVEFDRRYSSDAL